jgi:hypothetical protein
MRVGYRSIDPSARFRLRPKGFAVTIRSLGMTKKDRLPDEPNNLCDGFATLRLCVFKVAETSDSFP